MTNQEIKEFIESMEEIGDIWEEADVERVYGTTTLEDALQERRALVGTFFGIIGKVLDR